MLSEETPRAIVKLVIIIIKEPPPPRPRRAPFPYSTGVEGFYQDESVLSLFLFASLSFVDRPIISKGYKQVRA